MIRPFFTRLGGKSRLRVLILSMLPKRKLYCEPFVGADWVFLGYEGAEKYVLIDADKQIASMWNYIETHTLGEFLKEGFDIRRSEEIFRANKDIYKGKTWKSDGHLLYLYRYLQYYGVMGDYETPIAEGSSLKKKIILPLEGYNPVHNLLISRNVFVWNDDWKKCEEYDGEDSVFYLDPPWEGNICQDRYGHSTVDYVEILDFIRRARGFVLMTCNEAALKDRDLSGLKMETVAQKYASCNFVKNSGGRKVQDSKVVMVTRI